MWYHTIDRNADHPKAAGDMITGCGDPTHVKAPGIYPNKPGLYHLKSWNSNGSIFDGGRLPLIFSPGQEWATAPTAKFAIQRGYQVEIDEAHIFMERHRIFKGWVDDLWLAREALRSEDVFPHEAGRMIARDTVKLIMNATIPSLRLNWWADMLGQARTNTLVSLGAIVEKLGLYPCVVFHDAIGFISPDPNPETALAGLLSRQRELGGYKLVYSLQITQELVDNIGLSCEPDRFIKTMHKYARLAGVR
jgi:hypothetical protein